VLLSTSLTQLTTLNLQKLNLWFLSIHLKPMSVLLFVLQLAYMLLVGTFPFNGFLAGFLSSLGFFTLTGAGLFFLVWKVGQSYSH